MTLLVSLCTIGPHQSRLEDRSLGGVGLTYTMVPILGLLKPRQKMSAISGYTTRNSRFHLSIIYERDYSPYIPKPRLGPRISWDFHTLYVGKLYERITHRTTYDGRASIQNDSIKDKQSEVVLRTGCITRFKATQSLK